MEEGGSADGGLFETPKGEAETLAETLEGAAIDAFKELFLGGRRTHFRASQARRVATVSVNLMVYT